jgi:thymidylate synthase ThyX
MISAKIIADSICSGIRLTTMELNYPRFIHSEFMTHRMFSRNASSSRAIPIEKNIVEVQDNLVMPIHWGKNQPGMQAKEEIIEIGEARDQWIFASDNAVYHAEKLHDLGIHKQVANRLLEPFQYIKVIVTATEWENFFNLRLHPDAQPEMKQLAVVMQAAMNGSTPDELTQGQWHLPYISWDERSRLTRDVATKCSVARCARVSYLNHDNSYPDVEKDIALADRLLKDGHMSPFEHQATPMNFKYIQQWYDLKGVTHQDVHGENWSGNFRGWLQYRQML